MLYSENLEKLKGEITEHLRLWAASSRYATISAHGQKPQSVRRLWRLEILDMVKRAKRYRDAVGLS